LIPWFLVVAVFSVLAATTLSVVALVVAGVVAAAMWRWPDAVLEVAAFAVLTVRPSLDVFSERRAGLSQFMLNPAVAFGLGVLWIACVGVLVRGRQGRTIWPSPILLGAHSSLLVTYGIAFSSGAWLYGLLGATTGAREATRVLSIIAAFLIVLWWVEVSPDRYRRGWVYLLAGTLVPVGAAWWQWATGRGELGTEGFNRVVGTFSHPNSLGTFLVPFILLAVGGLQNSAGAARITRVAGALGLTVLEALTYSRTATLALVTGIALIPLLHSRRFGWRGLLRGLALVTVGMGLTWWLLGDVLRARFVNLSFSRAAWDAARTGISENSFTWRLINWGGLIAEGMAHPIVGHGAGMTTVLNPLISPTNGIPFNAHNDFVRFFFEGGLLGVLGYLVYGILLCAWVLRRARVVSPLRAASAYAVAAAWIAILFLTLGTPELSLQTAVQYDLYAMTALLAASEEATQHIPESLNLQLTV
jgi:hypothetical protein